MRLRPASVVAGLALATTALVAVPAPAQAAAITSAVVYSGRTVNEVGPATCTAANTSSNSNSAFNSDGVTITTIASGTTTLEDTGDASDDVSYTTSTTSRIKATEAGGQLRSVDLDVRFAGSYNAAQGLATDCDASASLISQFTFQTVLSAPRWVTLDAALPPGATLQAVFQRTAPAAPSVQEVMVLSGTQKGHARAEILLPAGTYFGTGTLGMNVAAPQAPGDPTTFDYTPHIDIDLLAVGSAKAAAVGDGTAYAKLKDSRDCTKNTLKGTFSKAAGTKAKPTLKKAIFKVNGTKSKVIKKAKKGGKITLKNLPADQDVQVKATFKLVGGGSVSFTRDYYSCT